MFHRFPPHKCFKFYCYLSNILLQKRGIGYAKIIHKNRANKNIGKNGQLSEVLKQWVLRCPPKNEMNKIAHVFLQRWSQVQMRDMFSRSIVELG